ncbi:uncharacterized protein LOC129884317 [Solanum dulcamara]|uniref:uncharacterized protein LOC129884317 n=1 Tax=Solanum dulcamara TaxID=45834 RepID=UPI00248561DA|nr:uncharacterized protein LOC129884317 [Solanum dulcamara]
MEQEGPCMVPLVKVLNKEGQAHLSAMQLVKVLKKGEPNFVATIASLDEGNGAKETLPPCIEKVLEENRDVMPEELPRHLPLRCEVDHKIELEPGARPPGYPPYHMAPPELEELRKQLEELLEAGHIHPSKAPYGAPVQGELRMDEVKVRAIKEWEAPTKVTELRFFLGLANYYRRFISAYSARAASLTELLKKNKLWVWSEECKESFEDLKAAVTEEPVLALLDFSKTFEMHTDASDYAIGGVLMQERHPIAFESRKLNETEWHYFQSQKKLHPKQARWQDFLAEFDYKLEYKLGKGNIVADALSRKFELAAITTAHCDILDAIKDGLQYNLEAKRLMELAAQGKTRRFWVEDGLLLTAG